MTYTAHTAPNGQFVVADVQPFIEESQRAIAALVDLTRPEASPPLCRQEIPAEGTE